MFDRILNTPQHFLVNFKFKTSTISAERVLFTLNEVVNFYNLQIPLTIFMLLIPCICPLYTRVQSANSVTQHRTVWSALAENRSLFTTYMWQDIKVEETLKCHWVCRPPYGEVSTMDARTRAIFQFSTGNTLFGQICSKKIKFVSLNWNLVPTLIRVCRIKCWCSNFSFLTGNTPFWTNLFKKIKTVIYGWDLVHRLIRICIYQWWYSFFLF